MKEANICSGHNKPQSSGASGAVSSYMLKDILKCTCKATLFENGKWYCKRHAPSKIAERYEKAWQTYINKINSNIEKNQNNNSQ